MNAMGMSQLSKATFKAAMTPMPFQYKPAPDSGQYSQAFSAAEQVGIPNPMALFVPATMNKYHTDATNAVSQKFEDYIDGMIAAIGGAVDQWIKLAVLVNVKVMAVSAIGQPGCFKGPPMYPLIMGNSPPMKTQQEQKYSKAIAKAVGDAWDNWAKNVTVPGLPWYPAFAAFPGPVAPPTPNIPVPLILLPSSGMADMTPPKLANAMKSNLGDSKALHQQVLFQALGTGIGTMFLAWLPSVMVTNVLGTGPIPTFAPPFVPVGPVMNGMANQTPSGMVSPPSGAAGLKTPKGPDEVEKIKQKTKELEQKAKNSDQEAKQAMEKLKADVKQAQQQASQDA